MFLYVMVKCYNFFFAGVDIITFYILPIFLPFSLPCIERRDRNIFIPTVKKHSHCYNAYIRISKAVFQTIIIYYYQAHRKQNKVNPLLSPSMH